MGPAVVQWLRQKWLVCRVGGKRHTGNRAAPVAELDRLTVARKQKAGIDIP